MHVIVTMAGHSRRFNAAGLAGPKWLLPVGDKKMIEHVVDMFNPDDTFHLVVNATQVKDNPESIEWLRTLAADVRISQVAPHEGGPAVSALQVSDIPDDAPVIVTYCDFIVGWDYNQFLRHVHGADGAVVSFSGFHPASYGSTLYAYMRTDGERMLELREKRSFTDDRVNEPASTGIYYFADFASYRHYAEILVAAEQKELPEAYVSLLFNLMVADGKEILLHQVEHFICLGTPEDYEQFQFWHNYFAHEQLPSSRSDDGAKCVNLLPMAGHGSRFREYGYRVAKPLVQVRGDPMVFRTIKSLPQASEWIFLPRAEDLQRHPIARAIQRFEPNSRIVPVTEHTSGQAATCLLAEDYIDPDAGLIISSCDYEHRFDPSAWQAILDDGDIDGAIWTVRLGASITKDPNAFAYCRTHQNSIQVSEVIEKRTISENPGQDPLVVGTFWFRRAGDFARGARAMIAKGETIGGEHYVGTSINQLLAEGAKFVIFEIEQWISFGDPFELQLLEYWEGYFQPPS
jgi:NDP-sugar pyrophosphorylase family protein